MKKANSIKEAMVILDTLLDKAKNDERENIENMYDENDMIIYHSTVGRNIRNEWKLWDPKPNKLKEELKNFGSGEHPDDMSMFILKIFYHHVKNPEKSIDSIINERIIKNLVE